jgi:hypothetical protein
MRESFQTGDGWSVKIHSLLANRGLRHISQTLLMNKSSFVSLFIDEIDKQSPP